MYTWIDLACLAAGALAAGGAAYVDHRTLRIPNRLTFPIIFAGLAILALRCILGYPLQLAAILCIISYLFVYGLWKFHMWGGGDAKLVLGLFLLVSPAWPPLRFIVAYSLCLAAILLVKHGVYRHARMAPGGVHAKGDMRSMKGGPLSAEDIASLRERPGEPMGPSLLIAYIASIVLLEAAAWLIPFP